MTYPGQFEGGEGWPDPRGGYRQSPEQPAGSRYQRAPGGYQHPPEEYLRQTPQYGPRHGHRPSAPPGEPPRSGGAEGNERLTAITGAVLLVLLAAEGYTILRIGRLLTLHVFLGFLLLGPVTLKAGSVIYRFIRYYTGNVPYKRKGPPAPLLRVIGPLIVLLTAAVFGSGIMLVVVGPVDEQQWLTIHRLTFIAWFCVMVIHVLAYVPRLPRLLAAEARGVSLEDGTDRRAIAGQHVRRAVASLGGRGTRLTLLIASLVAGLVIALLTVHLTAQWHFGGLPVAQLRK